MMDSWEYADKVQRLDEILRKGIHELCTHAKDKNYLNYPYGRNEGPTPLISEEEFVKQGGLKCDDTEPVFQYEYGFDPLKFLSDYIVWAHPQSVENRRQAKLAAQERLVFRANHAKRQLEMFDLLKVKITHLQAGIEWGPVLLPMNFSTIKCTLKPYQHGIIYLQVSTDPTFTTVSKTYKLLCPPPGSMVIPCASPISTTDGHIAIQSWDIPGLSEKTCYYFRTHAFTTNEYTLPEKCKSNLFLLDTDKEQDEIAEITTYLSGHAVYQNSAWTLPDDNFSMLPGSGGDTDGEDESAPPTTDSIMSEHVLGQSETLLTLQFFGQLPLPAFQRMKYLLPHQTANPSAFHQSIVSEDTNTKIPKYHCLLGDLFTHTTDPDYQLLTLSEQDAEQDAGTETGSDIYVCKGPKYVQQLDILFARLLQLVAFTHGSWCMAWRDSAPTSSAALRQEESLYRQYRHEYRKYCKKYGLEESSGGKKKTNPKKQPQHTGNGIGNTGSTLPPPPVLRRPPLTPQVAALNAALPLLPVTDTTLTGNTSNHTGNTGKNNGITGNNISNTGTNNGNTGNNISNTGTNTGMDTLPSTRMFYRSTMIGGEIHLILLDYRPSTHSFSLGCDYLGKEQAEWLTHTLQSSPAAWKIIAAGKAFGVVASNTHVDTDIHIPGSNPASNPGGNAGGNPGGSMSGEGVRGMSGGVGGMSGGVGGMSGGVGSMSGGVGGMSGGVGSMSGGVGNMSGDVREGAGEEGSVGSERGSADPPLQVHIPAPAASALKSPTPGGPPDMPPTTPGGHPRQVQLLLPPEVQAGTTSTTAAAHHPHGVSGVAGEKAHICLYDDCEEMYGRSKYSLQHILATYQQKQREAHTIPGQSTGNTTGNNTGTGTTGAGILPVSSTGNTTGNTTGNSGMLPVSSTGKATGKTPTPPASALATTRSAPGTTPGTTPGITNTLPTTLPTTVTGIPPLVEEDSTPDGPPVIPVSSGILLLTSGITTFYTKNLHTDDTEHIIVESLVDTQSPAYVTSYFSLSSPLPHILPIDFSIANRPTVLDALADIARTSSDIVRTSSVTSSAPATGPVTVPATVSAPDSASDTSPDTNATQTPLSLPYCVEIGLGQGNLSSIHSLSQQANAMYHYLPGLEAYNYFLNAEGPGDGPGQEDDPTRNHFTTSELSLLPNGSLHVKLLDQVLPTDEYHDTTSAGSVSRIPLFECILTLPSGNGSESDDQSSSVYVA